MDATTPIPTSREQLCALLAEAAEIEHHLMCSYLYAAFSLKTGADEALTERELVATRRWRQEILAVAIEEMGHLTMVCNILSSLGAPAHLVHQNFPILPGFHPSGVVIRLAPFSPEVIAHFVYLERPEGAQVADGLGYEPVQGYVRQLSMDRLMTVCTDYDTVGQLYRSITAGLESLSAALGEQRLFVGNPAHQLDSGVAQLPGLRTVQCLSTALACIDAIVLQGEGADACSEDSHYRRFLSIQEEYRQLLEQRPAFRPARECAENPVMRPPPTPQGRVWVQREPAACLLDLANALYNHCLRCLALAYAGVDRGTQRMLVAAGVDLMHLLTPVAQVLSTLPAGDQGRTPAAGMSFATIRSAAALMAGGASIGILIERLMEIADRCGQLAGRHPALAALLVSTGEGAARIAGRLPAHTDAAALVVADAVIRRPPPALVPALGPVQVPAAPPVPTSTPDAGVQVIHGKGLDILYAGVRCIHARHCVLEIAFGVQGQCSRRMDRPERRE